VACAIAMGRAFCWGKNFSGEVGDGTQDDKYVPTPVVGLGSGVTAISTGGEGHSCAIQRGNVYCWGIGGWMTGTLTPELVPFE